jgi:putative transcriptional regulator
MSTKTVTVSDLLTEAIDNGYRFMKGKKRLRVTEIEISEAESFPPNNNISMIRQTLNMPVETFAEALNVSSETVRRWEEGSQRPRGTAVRLLQVIQEDPKLVVRCAKTSPVKGA